MSELIAITDEVRARILVTQNWKDPVNFNPQTYWQLTQKAKKDLFTPEPPVIVQPMPAIYQGNFLYHLYNGNTRFRVAREHQKKLYGLVVTSDDEVPEGEFFPGQEKLQGMLRNGLINLFGLRVFGRRTPNYTLEFLIAELMRRESLGLMNEMPDYQPKIDPAIEEVLKKHFGF